MLPSVGQQWAELALCVLVGMGLSVTVVWPAEGPGAVVRETLRKLGPKDTKLWDCYVCLGFWATVVWIPVFGAHTLLAPFLTVLVFWCMIPQHQRYMPKAKGCPGCNKAKAGKGSDGDTDKAGGEGSAGGG